MLLFHQRVYAAASGECCSSNLMERVTNLETQSSLQKGEIFFLKTTVNQLRGRVATLEAEKASTGDAMTIGREKRPFRLLRPHVSR